MAEFVHLPNISFRKGKIKVDVPLSKIGKNFEKAQYWLDSQIMNDMVPYMPHVTGIFTNLTRAQSAAIAGTGLVYAAASTSYGRFLYFGKVMVDPETGSPFARPGVKKILTDRPLKYSSPETVPEWFEVAKEQHMTDWVDGVEKILTEDI